MPVETAEARAYDHEKRLSIAEARIDEIDRWRANRDAESSKIPALALTAVSAAVSIAMLLLNLWVASGGGR